MDASYRPLTIENWDDFTELFGTHGGYSGCWCVYWRITRKEFSENGNAGNKQSMRELIEQGVVPGIITYHEEKPIGWISIAPREDFGSLERSPTLKRVDEEAVWSIVCFYVPKDARGGMLSGMIAQAVDFAKKNGAKIIEAYPNKETPPGSKMEHYMGKVAAFQSAGFKVIAERGTKLYMRKYL